MELGQVIGSLAILLAIIVGILEAAGVIEGAAWISVVLVIAGIIIGLLNITAAESVPFMLGALIIAGGAVSLAVIPFVGEFVQIIFAKIAAVVVPAAIVVALGTVYDKMKG